MSPSLTIGQFEPALREQLRQFELVFHTENLRLTWSHSDLAANFISQYFTNAFPTEAEANPDLTSREEMIHTLNYLINELMENVIKFHQGSKASLSGGVTSDVVGFLVTNEVPEEKIPPFAAILEEITSGDPGLLLLQKIEQNAENAEGTGSGLGYLTLMNDYQARLGWQIEPVKTAPGQTQVTIMACLNLRKNS
jgi:hypothetical protein